GAGAGGDPRLGGRSGDADGVGLERLAAALGGAPRGTAEEGKGVSAGSQRAAPEGDVELLEGVLAPRRAEHPRGLADQPPLRVPDLDLVVRIAVTVAGVEEEGGRPGGQRDGSGGRGAGGPRPPPRPRPPGPQ